MNVLVALIGAISMQLAPTLREVTPALATPDTQAEVFLVLVIFSTIVINKYLNNNVGYHQYVTFSCAVHR